MPNDAGEQIDCLSAESLQSHVIGLWEGYSSHSGRGTFASSLLAQGHSIEIVPIVLGQAPPQPCVAVA